MKELVTLTAKLPDPALAVGFRLGQVGGQDLSGSGCDARAELQRQGLAAQSVRMSAVLDSARGGRAMIRAFCLWLALASGAAADCRQALVLGLDVSGSVDGREYRLQIEGLAGALVSDDVRGALLANPAAPVRIAVFEWSGPAAQRLILPWTELRSDTDVTVAAAQIAGTRRVRAEPTTAIGAAMHHGGRLLAQQSACWQLTLDLSGDGKSNVGTRPQDVQPGDLPAGMTINGLVIGAEPEEAAARRLVEIGELVAYYDAYVIRGPQAFTEVALAFEDYQDAMRRKLLRELQSLAIGKRRTP